ncbi:MAG TPA: hypothetical protein VHX20_01155 [Terracidiphilus sp.]|nr:hypothetical protein [Terracidiphilus sp.]
MVDVVSESDLISEQSLPWTNREPSGRKTRPTKAVYCESSDHRSATQHTDSELAYLLEAAANEGIVLPAAWRRYLKFMDVVAEKLFPKDGGTELKKLALEDARSRRFDNPPAFPAKVGTPAEFKERLADHTMEIRTRFSRRIKAITIRVYQLPPDVDEYLDPNDDPKGHWEGLSWIPDQN